MFRNLLAVCDWREGALSLSGAVTGTKSRHLLAAVDQSTNQENIDTLSEHVDGIDVSGSLVNDQRGKRRVVFDSTVASFTIIADGVSRTGVHDPYRGLINPLMRYIGDSSLMVDPEARTYVVIDPDGRMAPDVKRKKAIRPLLIRVIPSPLLMTVNNAITRRTEMSSRDLVAHIPRPGTCRVRRSPANEEHGAQYGMPSLG